MPSLRTISVACWLSLLVAGVVLAISFSDLHDWPTWFVARWWAALALWAVPFGAILELARRRQPKTLALALGFGVASVSGPWWVPQWFRTDTEYAHSFAIFPLGLLVTVVLQGIMAVNALRIGGARPGSLFSGLSHCEFRAPLVQTAPGHPQIFGQLPNVVTGPHPFDGHPLKFSGIWFPLHGASFPGNCAQFCVSVQGFTPFRHKPARSGGPRAGG